MQRWTELHTAYTVARLGTVSAAAEALGLHRATVVRHVDTLEAALGGRLFQRHARGYTRTDAGEALLRVGAATEEHVRALAGQMRGAQAAVSGELIVTSIELVAPLVMPALARFQREHPDTRIEYAVSARVLRLEYGEAHVAIRMGPRPSDPDNVVQPWGSLGSSLVAHRTYVDAHGRPDLTDGLAGHRLVRDARAPVAGWLDAIAPRGRVVFESRDDRVVRQAVQAGLGVGVFPTHAANTDPDLVVLQRDPPGWAMPLWRITHVDLHRTAKVQAFCRALGPSAYSGTTPA